MQDVRALEYRVPCRQGQLVRVSFCNGTDVFAGAYASSSVGAGATCDVSSQRRGRRIAMVADGPIG